MAPELVSVQYPHPSSSFRPSAVQAGIQTAQAANDTRFHQKGVVSLFSSVSWQEA